MSCGPADAKFRLLDAYVGWSEEAAPEHLIGLEEDDPPGLRLAPVSEEPALSDLWNLFLPPRLARGCGPCDWYLLTPAPSRLLKRQPCPPKWQPVWTRACDPGLFVDPTGVAAWGHRVAIADRGAGRIWIWGREGLRLIAEIAFPGVLAIAYTPAGELLAVQASTRTDAPRLQIFGPGGERRRRRIALPAEARDAVAVACGRDGALWLLTGHDGARRLWRAAPGVDHFVRADLAELQASLERNGLGPVTDRGFCLTETGRDGLPVARCQDWYGRCVSSGEIGVPAAPALHQEGELLTVALDSGIPRCRWHRVRVDADVPAGTGLLVQTASVDDPDAQPHSNDWRPLAGSLDFLVDQPPGRYLRVRIKLTGDGKSTPVVRRVRLDFPRSTSLERLPPVYREDPRAEDFTERFLSLFDAGMSDLDDAIERLPALLDVQGVPDPLLPWLASFLDLTFDPAWDPGRQRAILKALPRLYRLRGTIAGLQLAIQVVFDAQAAVQELGSERMWGKIGRGGTAVLRGVRLFGKSKARFILGRSPLSKAPLKSSGNPDHDPVAAGAHRFRVLVPPGALTSGAGRQRLARLVESQKPAHTQATLRVGGSGWLIGSTSAVGVDSVLGPLPAPVIGRSGNVKLRRMSVLWPARRGGRPAFVLGNPIIAGIQTVME